MPSPNDARKTSTKKTPEKNGDLSHKLSKRRSQDFNSKILDWNQTGAGIFQKEDGVIAVEKEAAKPTPAKEPVAVVVVDVDAESSQPDIVDDEGEDDDASPASPTSPVSPDSGGKAIPKPTGAKKAARAVDLNRKAWVRRKSKPQVEVPAEVKNAGTPKKRVLSDGHWRKDRPAKGENTPPEKEKEREREVTPKPVVIRRSVVSVGLRVPPSTFDLLEPEPEPTRVRPLRNSRSRSHSISGSERDATPDYETPGTKVYIKRQRRSKLLDAEVKTSKILKASDSSTTAPSSMDIPGSTTDITLPSPSPAGYPLDRRLSEPRLDLKHSLSRERASRSKTTKPIDTEDDFRRLSSGRRKSKTPVHEDEGLRPSHSRKASEPIKRSTSMSAAPTPPSTHGNRIEGWLAGMSDPFTDSQNSPASPHPLDIPEKKSRKSLEPDKDYIYESAQPTRSGRERHSRRSLDTGEKQPSSPYTPDNDDRRAPNSATPKLKRSGARRNSRSPVKGRGSREGSATTDEPVMSGALPDPHPRDSRRSAEKPSRRSFPSGGQRLATIASVETLRSRGQLPSQNSKNATGAPDGSLLSRASDGDGNDSRRNGPGLKRRLTKHSDLISVLSMPRDDTNALVSARSIRARRPNLETATAGDLMNEVSADELKYQRELRTLVDGVIPVLLQYALSGSGSSSKAQIFSGTTRESAVTDPIVEMGVALERLKSAHKRIPLHEPSDLITWAESTSKLYADYMRSWRLGFKDVVVNLAPADAVARRDGSSDWDHDLPRNQNGDLLSGDGERVDVAYLLKRPLVRLKYLTRTLKGIHQIRPSAKAESVANTYQGLVTEAKKRASDEKARLEDEAASSIDPTRARDPRTLGLISGVVIDPTRCVHARDYFDMELMHSSGQQLGCKIEIIYRDDAPDRGKAGDILFCEISTSGRWLLFPPLPFSLVSARKGERPTELIVMVRGFQSDARQWREVMSIFADDDQTSSDWVHMLGSSPMPPKLSSMSSFNMLKESRVTSRDTQSTRINSQGSPEKSREPSPREIEVPIGEQAKSSSRIWDGSEVNSVSCEPSNAKGRSELIARYRNSLQIAPPRRSESESRPDYFYEKSRDDRHTGPSGSRPKTTHLRSNSEVSSSRNEKGYNVWLPSSDIQSDESAGEEDDVPSQRPAMRRRTSSVPSNELPTIPKLRKTVRLDPSTPHSDQRRYDDRAVHIAPDPASAPSKLQKTRVSKSRDVPEKLAAAQTYARPTTVGLRSGALPSFTPAFLKKNWRSSSPLKHEYEPSSASDSMSDSDVSGSEEIDSVTSESTVDVEEGVSTVGDLKAFQEYTNRPFAQSAPVTPSHSVGGSLGPSESASQAPYRTVPPNVASPSKTVACIFSWSDRGSWESLHPEECSIYVTPGRIEAFDLTQAHSVSLITEDGIEITPTSKGIKPLVALELTPLVPLRRGTALDISIRSPPTASSLIRTGDNVMFRSRSPEECEKLYALINRARIDNPTYIALQNARGPVQQSNWAEIMDRRNATRSTSGSWWTLGSKKSSTYRSTGSRPASIAATESSIGTMNTAFSALRRFSGGSRIFNIAKSTITSREGTRSSNSESLSSDAAVPLPIDPKLGTPLGITNAKVRMYVRESASKWRDMGSARLTVVLPPRQDPIMAANPNSTGLGKRILVYGKSKGETLLDVTLGESCFERVARTGIAVSVWEEVTGPNGEVGQVGAVGGVLNAKAKVYMIQMKSVSAHSSCVGVMEENLADHHLGTRRRIYVWFGGQASILVMCSHEVRTFRGYVSDEHFQKVRCAGES